MNIGKIKPVNITDELQKSYLDYSMSVIVSRALPDIRDGLKPVHRRILYAMKDMGLSHSASYKKSARIVGEVLGKYHPHGDMAVYDALVRMAQDFSLRYPLIDGQGNFGSVDGDPAAAMRYTEAKLSKITDELLYDLEKNTVDFADNFDGAQKEPTVLPAKLPNLLLMGSDGIAVGMATKIPPHNLGEVVDALKAIIKKGKIICSINNQQLTINNLENLSPKLLTGEFESQATLEDLLTHIKGPDFPTGGEIYNWQQIVQVYATGRGKITVRGVAQISEKKGKYQITISQLPYQVNKARLILKIAQLVKSKRLRGIANVRDESDRRGMQIVVILKKEAKPKAILNSLFKYTDLQTNFPANMVALVDGVPRLLPLKRILEEYLAHRQLVVVRRSQFELKNAKHRAHILEGLMIALKNLDAVIATIKKSKDAEVAKANLMRKFALTETQAIAILDMQLRRLAALERQKIEDEYKMIKESIEYLLDLLNHPEKIVKLIDEELTNLKQKFADERRTKVFKKALEEFSEEDLIPKKECLVTITKTGYIKRLSPATYRAQRRGGKGVSGMTTKEEDEITHLLSASTHDEILFFTNKGRVFKQKVYDLPEGSRQSKGQAVINLINIDQGEKIQSVLSLKKETNGKFLLLATKKGQVKKTPIEQFANIRTSGIIAIKLAPNDSLIKAVLVSENDHILMVTRTGKSIRFSQGNIRPMGRAAGGVRGIFLKANDEVVATETFPEKPQKEADRRRKHFRDLLVVMERGLGKRTPLELFPVQKRGGVGVKAAMITQKTGKLVCAKVVTQKNHQIILTSKKAQVIRLPLRNIKRIGRNTQGVILMRFAKAGDSIAAVTCLRKEEE